MAFFRPRPRTIIGAGAVTTVVASLAVLAPGTADIADVADPELNLDVYDFPLVIDEDATLENEVYLTQHDNIWATADASMQAWQQTGEESMTFTTTRGMIGVPLPGGIGTPGVWPRPETVSKDGWIGSNRTEAFWRMFIPGSLVESADPVTVVNQISEELSYWEDSVRITSVPDTQEGWGEFQANDGQAVDPDRYEVPSSGNELSIDLQPTPSCCHAVPAQLVAI